MLRKGLLWRILIHSRYIDIPGSESAIASMRRTYNEAIKHLKESENCLFGQLRMSFYDICLLGFPPGDPYLRLEKGRIQAEVSNQFYFKHTEDNKLSSRQLYVVKESQRSRSLYEEYTKKHPSNSELWYDFVQFERYVSFVVLRLTLS